MYHAIDRGEITQVADLPPGARNNACLLVRTPDDPLTKFRYVFHTDDESLAGEVAAMWTDGKHEGISLHASSTKRRVERAVAAVGAIDTLSIF